MNEAASDASRVLSDVTIVVPVWDTYVRRFLPQALDSLAQHAHGARVIIVDNASTVPLPAHNGATLVRSPSRLSVGGARNLGLGAVDTPFVVFWDADDIVLPGALIALRAHLDNGTDVVAAVSAIVDDTTEPYHWPRPATWRLARFPALFGVVHCVSSLFPSTGCVMMRTEQVLDAAGFGDSDGGDDWMLSASLAFRGRVLLDARPGRLYRRHPDSISSRWRPVPDLVAHAAAVRTRVSTDPGVPRWVQRLAPALLLPQLLVIFVLGPLRRARRRFPRRP